MNRPATVSSAPIVIRFAVFVGLLGGCLGGPFDPEIRDNREELTPSSDSVIDSVCRPDLADPEADVRFSEVRAQVFDKRCGCHTTVGGLGRVVGRLDLADHDAVLAGGARGGDQTVVAGDPCASRLVQKLGPIPPFGARMPLDGSRLTFEQFQLVLDWIAGGARP